MQQEKKKITVVKKSEEERKKALSILAAQSFNQGTTRFDHSVKYDRYSF